MISEDDKILVLRTEYQDEDDLHLAMLELYTNRKFREQNNLEELSDAEKLFLLRFLQAYVKKWSDKKLSENFEFDLQQVYTKKTLLKKKGYIERSKITGKWTIKSCMRDLYNFIKEDTSNKHLFFQFEHHLSK